MLRHYEGLSRHFFEMHHRPGATPERVFKSNIVEAGCKIAGEGEYRQIFNTRANKPVSSVPIVCHLPRNTNGLTRSDFA